MAKKKPAAKAAKPPADKSPDVNHQAKVIWQDAAGEESFRVVQLTELGSYVQSLIFERSDHYDAMGDPVWQTAELGPDQFAAAFDVA